MAGTSREADDEYERRYMDPGERVLLREKVVSRGVFLATLIFAGLFGLAGLAAAGAAVLGAAPGGVGLSIGVPFIALAAIMGVLGVMFSVFRVMVTGSHLHVHFGWAKRKIPLSAIQAARVVRLQGIKQGKVQMGFDGVVRTWVGESKSRQAVEVRYQVPGGFKHILTIGSEDAERLLETLQTAAAGHGEAAGLRIAEDAELAAEAEAEAEAQAEAARSGEARR